MEYGKCPRGLLLHKQELFHFNGCASEGFFNGAVGLLLLLLLLLFFLFFSVGVDYVLVIYTRVGICYFYLLSEYSIHKLVSVVLQGKELVVFWFKFLVINVVKMVHFKYLYFFFSIQMVLFVGCLFY